MVGLLANVGWHVCSYETGLFLPDVTSRQHGPLLSLKYCKYTHSEASDLRASEFSHSLELTGLRIAPTPGGEG